jgi:hypothetical protein
MSNRKHDKMFNIFSNQGNANQNYIEIPSHPSQNSCHQENKKQQTIARIQEIKEHLCIVDENVN